MRLAGQRSNQQVRARSIERLKLECVGPRNNKYYTRTIYMSAFRTPPRCAAAALYGSSGEPRYIYMFMRGSRRMLIPLALRKLAASLLAVGAPSPSPSPSSVGFFPPSAGLHASRILPNLVFVISKQFACQENVFGSSRAASRFIFPFRFSCLCLYSYTTYNMQVPHWPLCSRA